MCYCRPEIKSKYCRSINCKPPTSSFTRVAREKVSNLIRAAEFKDIESITNSLVIINFQKRQCSVDSFGRVVWSPSSTIPEIDDDEA